MAGKPLAEQVQELTKLAATLTERVDHARKDIERVDAAQSRTADALTEIHRDVAVLREQLNGLRSRVEEAASRRWGLLTLILSALLACGLGIVSSVVTTRLNLGK